MDHVLVAVHINLAIDCDMNLASGKLDNNISQQITSTHGKHGTLYLNTMEQHNTVLQAAAITNKLILLGIFPNHKAVSTIYKTKSSVDIIYATPNVEEDLASEIASLARSTP